MTRTMCSEFEARKQVLDDHEFSLKGDQLRFPPGDLL